MFSSPRKPSDRDIFWFGLLLPVFVGVLGVVVRWGWGIPTASVWIWGVGAAVSVFWVAPALRRPLYQGWMVATLPIGWVVSHLLLSVIYYGVLTPVGLVMRLLGYDPMCRRLDRKAKSYWMVRAETPDAKRYFRQF